MLAAIYQSVFRPDAFCRNPKGQVLIDRYGWIFIAIRWLYYSVVFSLFRDYHSSWKPFADPPFGLSLKKYATLQKIFAPIFGFFLMASMTGSLVTYLRMIGKEVPTSRVFNILGVTFFLPFLILQPLDLLAISKGCWRLSVIPLLHTVVLVWEAIAAMAIVHRLYRIRVRDRIAGVGLIVGVWILIARSLWR